MPLRISIPLRLNNPINAIKPNGMPVSKKPGVTPMSASGTVSQMATAFFTELNIRMVMINITRYPIGSVEKTPCCASLELSASPPHSML
ncbi:hypothetical protein D3C87_1764940 [compost metagenome]